MSGLSEAFKYEAAHLVWTLEQAEELRLERRLGDKGAFKKSSVPDEKTKPKYIDLGGGNGYFACHLAMDGYDVLVVDDDDYKEVVADRNNYLAGCRSTFGEMKFYQADVLKIDASRLVAQGYNENPILVTALNFAHHQTSAGMNDVFKLVSETLAPGGLFSLYYIICDDPNFGYPLHNHGTRGMMQLATKHGFDLVRHWPEEIFYEKKRDGRRYAHVQTCMSEGFCLTRPPEKNRLYGEKGASKDGPC